MTFDTLVAHLRHSCVFTTKRETSRIGFGIRSARSGRSFARPGLGVRSGELHRRLARCDVQIRGIKMSATWYVRCANDMFPVPVWSWKGIERCLMLCVTVTLLYWPDQHALHPTLCHRINGHRYVWISAVHADASDGTRSVLGTYWPRFRGRSSLYYVKCQVGDEIPTCRWRLCY